MMESSVTTNKFIVTLLVGFSVAAFASQAMAQTDEAKREAAMQKCLQMASQVPGDPTNQMGRIAAYKACMTEAGYRP